MRRSLCSDGSGLKKGPWSPEEDRKLITHIQNHGHPNWRALPKLAGLNRSGKSCRLRWTNYLSPNIKRGEFTQEEVQIIFDLHSVLGNKWSAIAKQLPGRTDNEIKNFWNTHLKKKLIQMGFDPMTHRPRTDLSSSLANIILQAQTLQYYLQYYLQYDHILQPPYALTNINNYNNPTEVEIMNLINSNNNNNNNTNNPLQPLGTDSVGQVLFPQLPSLETFPNNTNTNETAPFVDDHNYYIIDEGPNNCGDACSSSSFVGSSTSIWSDQFLLERSLFHHTPPSPPPDWL